MNRIAAAPGRFLTYVIPDMFCAVNRMRASCFAPSEVLLRQRSGLETKTIGDSVTAVFWSATGGL
jgi:hypothetical protein